MQTVRMHRLVARLGVALLIAAPLFEGAVARAADRPDPADFARLPFIQRMRLSPDGKSIAYLTEYIHRTHLCVLDLKSGEIVRFRIGDADFNGVPMPKEVGEYWWVGSERLVLKTMLWDTLYGAGAVDRDGRHWRGLTWLERDPTGRTSDPAFELVHVFNDGTSRILMLDIKGGVGNERLFPNVLELDTETGVSQRVVQNPGNVTDWICDNNGVVRIGIARNEKKNWARYRRSESAPWKKLPLPESSRIGRLHPLGFDTLNGQFYVAGLNDNRRWAVYPFNLESGTIGDALVSDPVYDTLGGGFSPGFNGVGLARPIFSEAQGHLVGISYVTDVPHVKWFDKEYAHIQAAVDHSLPDHVNILVNESTDGRRMLYLSFSDRDPGTYHLLDRDARTFKPIGNCMDWLKPSEMSPMYAVHYAARDGTEIQGYLTVPRGHKPAGLPLVVLPHGGPSWRDLWGFDPLVQLIASRGYAVLQMNYRGSRGYGADFEELGRRQVGRAIQTDIEDATRWAIAAGVADPKRIAIAGGSYGGYSALYALGQSPGLYRCGISLEGVTDWFDLLDKSSRDPLMVFARKHWEKSIGDPDQDEAFLRSISPVYFADKITEPTLIIQTKDDRIVPQSQARKMADAMDAAGHPAELLMLDEGNHNISDERARTKAFTEIAEFLDKHLGPGVEFRPDP